MREERVEPRAALEARPHASSGRRVVAVHDDDDLDCIITGLVREAHVRDRAVALGGAVHVDALVGERRFDRFDRGVERGRVGGTVVGLRLV